MTGTTPESGAPVPLPLAMEIDRVCDLFEQELKAGREPQIEDYLTRVVEAGRKSLLRELLWTELEFRCAGTVPVNIDEYRLRFPDCAELIADAFARQASTVSWNAEGLSQSRAAAEGSIDIRGCRRGGHEDRDTTPIPQQIGRYVVRRRLGRGAFGEVFLAHDPDLNRPVALKVPRPDRFPSSAALDRFVDEARTAARLDHPGIVRVYDISRDTGTLVVVLEYVEGRTLAETSAAERLRPEQVARLMADVAHAVNYANEAGLVHRDLKPANILLDVQGHPRVADFGLAIHEETQRLRKGEIAGSPPYMAPEQVRGEAHRLDGRTDQWSLGVILYELLTGRRPFVGDSTTELFEEIDQRDPKPPRQINSSIPAELERICLKCLSKRMSDRYPTVGDLATDLRHWLEIRKRPATGPAGKTLAEAGPQAASADAEIRQPPRIIPKGLRSFDEHDADFFLELLPGPRDRDGLPENIRFWKSRIEESDADRTFAVGLIYGPSGCGKSSLLRAGLLPRLSERVDSVYVEATAADTEVRLLNGLRKHFPGIPRDIPLPELLSSLREGRWRPGKKLLIVLDQFEQWLHAHGGELRSQLTDALRQCDGGRVQCIVLVRDDFWMAATQFFRNLDVRLVEAENSAAVDLFPLRHAERVLEALGRAFGSLADDATEMTDEQKNFIRQAVAGLAEDGKVICVRLALFAEMMKGKLWTPVTLKEVGGTTGVGATFLEETFSASTAPPEHRYHQQAARAVLKALLPESGTDIKGQMKSRDRLLEASGYAHRPRDFEDLIRILDREIRLITPTDPEGSEPDDDSTTRAVTGQKYYQLTHDYLVYPLRDWLTSKQKATRRGRAELQLDDRAAAWSVKQEDRQLPSFGEYLHILGLTSRTKWTATQRRMMAAAGRHYVIRCAISCVVLLALLAGVGGLRHSSRQAQERARIDGLIDQLLVADVAELPRIAVSLERETHDSIARLEAIADNPANPESDRLRAAFVLVDGPGLRASQLIVHAESCDPPTLAIIRSRLAPFADALAHELWDAARDETSTLSSKLRVAALLATTDPSGDQWGSFSPTIVHALLSENTLYLDEWAELLRPAAARLVPNLHVRFADTSTVSSEHTAAARVLARYADAPLLSDLILGADPSQFSTLFSGTSRQGDAVTRILRRTLAAGSAAPQDPNDRARRLQNAMVALLRLGSWSDVGLQLSATADPTVRTRFVLELRDFGVPPETLLEAYEKLQDPTARQAVLLAMERYRGRELSPQTETRFTALLKKLLRDGRNPAERSAAEWLLRRRGAEETIDGINSEIAQAGAPPPDRLRDFGWWVDSEGHAMTVIRGPIRFTMGSPADEPGREDNESLVEIALPHSFAVAAHEVTLEQFKRFQPNASFAFDVTDELRCPANKVSLVAAMQYCRWLSEQERVEDDQMCYPPQDAIEANHVFLSDETLAKTGYRLPTEAEWEFACRAGTTTPWFFGDNEQHLQAFGWSVLNSQSRLHPVGTQMPNPWGLFDVAGNVSEWCRPVGTDQAFVLRGGTFQNPPVRIRSARRYMQSETGYSFTGFRVARTVTVDP